MCVSGPSFLSTFQQKMGRAAFHALIVLPVHTPPAASGALTGLANASAKPRHWHELRQAVAAVLDGLDDD
jgi:hypothetical protein